MTEIIQTLKAAAGSLLTASESGYIMEVFFHVNPFADGLTLTELLTWTGHDLNTPVEIQDFSDFFRTLTSTHPLMNSKQAATDQQLTYLQMVLKQELTHLQVYHLGGAHPETYIIGKDREGNFAGLKIAPILV